jgi:putative addiction module killer protein
MIRPYQIRHFLTSSGRDPFAEWRGLIRDSKARIAVDRRINRLELGNFGDHRHCREGVWELRIDVGPGYRVYYAMAGRVVVLLLCGGSKRTQEMDIAKACQYWSEWRQQGPGA